MTKILSCFISQGPYVIWFSFMVHMGKMMTEVFFIVSKFWFFVSTGGKRAENGSRWQKSSRSISQEAYVVWLWFLVHMCTIMASLDASFIFSKFDFAVVRGVKGQKMAQNDKKFHLTLYLRNRTSYDCGFWYTFVKWYILQFFSFFQNSKFLGF